MATQSQESAQLKRRRRAISIGITVATLSIAVVHITWPDLKIDTITLSLIGLALLPWIGQLIETLELPGGLKISFQKLEQQVQTIHETVQRIEEKVFFAPSPAMTSALQERLSTTLAAFSAYLERVGFTVPAERPVVLVDRSDSPEMLSKYEEDKNAITIAEAFADEPKILCRAYMHHVLLPRADGDQPSCSDAFMEIEHGLATYYACSFANRPVIKGSRSTKGIEGYVFDLRNRKPFVEVGSQHWSVAGEVWAAVFWEIRALLGQRKADQLLYKSWQASVTFVSESTGQRFVDNVMACAVPSEQEIRQILDRRQARPRHASHPPT